jgi:hypothetical protein
MILIPEKLCPVHRSFIAMSGRRPIVSVSAEHDDHGSGGDEEAADEGRGVELFAQQQPCRVPQVSILRPGKARKFQSENITPEMSAWVAETQAAHRLGLSRAR